MYIRIHILHIINAIHPLHSPLSKRTLDIRVPWTLIYLLSWQLANIFAVLLYLTLHLSTCPMFSPQVCEKCQLQVARLISQNVWHQNISKSSKWLFHRLFQQILEEILTENVWKWEDTRKQCQTSDPYNIGVSTAGKTTHNAVKRWRSRSYPVYEFVIICPGIG